jgi:hypothetical protein
MTDLSRKAAWRGLGIALLLMAATAGRATADEQYQKHGYVCSVQLSPAVWPLGQYGSVLIKLTSAQHCGGSMVASVVACSTGGQGGRPCERTQEPSGAYRFLYDEAQLNALYESLVIAARGQFQVSVTVDGEDRLRWVSFFAAGWVNQP